MASNIISRRRFLRAAGIGAAAGLAARSFHPALAQVPTTDPEAELISWNEAYNNPPMLGRVHGASWIKIFREPDVNAPTVRNIFTNDVIPVYRGLRSMKYDSRTFSDVWFETADGYVHSAYVVPCREFFHQPETSVPANTGFWGELTVPRAWQHSEPRLESHHWDFYHYRGFWAQVYKVSDLAVDDRGMAWYRIVDDIEERRPAWMLARNIRRVLPEEFTPISPEVEDKRIEIRLNDQIITCFEGSQIVFQTHIASGTTLVGEDGIKHDFSTPYGEYIVQRKRPARRMRGGEGPTEYDVNAVPWITYFTYTGAAIHGAYWHNNFGLPRSHGCINVTPDAGKWIYRWTQPYVTDLDSYRWTEKYEPATKIIIGE